MNTQVETAAETVVTAAPAQKPIKTLADVQSFVLERIALQNEITVVSADIEDVRDGGKILGKRIRLVLAGAGVEHPTRRHFLRKNSAFASAIRDSVVLMHAPKKERHAAEYVLFFGLNANAVSYEAPAPAKPEKVKLTAEEARDRRIAGKIAARQRREAEKAEAEKAAAESASVAETPADDNNETQVLESGEPVVIAQEETVEA